MTTHPAPYSAPIVELMKSRLAQRTERVRALDPFAGVGRGLCAFPPGSKVTMVEIEPEYAEDCYKEAVRLNNEGADIEVTVVTGDSRRDIPRRVYNLLCFSPTYGNRFTDGYRPLADCRSYAQSLRRQLTEGNTGAHPFPRMRGAGNAYTGINRDVMYAAVSRLCEDGEVWINVSDFYRTPPKKKGEPSKPVQLVPVTDWWIGLMYSLGFRLMECTPVKTRRFKKGENRHRVKFETLLIFADARTEPPSTRAKRRKPRRSTV